MAAMRCHPDRVPDEGERTAAGDQFRQIHTAYESLCEHFDNPRRRPRDTEFVTPLRTDTPLVMFFGDSPGCYAGPKFPPAVEACVIATRPESSETPIGFVDLAPEKGRISQYILFTNHRMYIRDATEILSVIWYDDLGEVHLIDREAEKKPGAWQRIAGKISGKRQRTALQIERQNGTRFYILDDRPDDSVKRVIYNFLRQMKSKSQA
jgi:hypothetical protein